MLFREHVADRPHLPGGLEQAYPETLRRAVTFCGLATIRWVTLVKDKTLCKQPVFGEIGGDRIYERLACARGREKKLRDQRRDVGIGNEGNGIINVDEDLRNESAVELEDGTVDGRDIDSGEDNIESGIVDAGIESADTSETEGEDMETVIRVSDVSARSVTVSEE
jgi:hypothetical protein